MLVAFLALLLLLAPGCALSRSLEGATLTIDLRSADEGVVRASLGIRALPGKPIAISSFLQPEALRAEDLQASQDGIPLPVVAGRDARGFARWEVGPPPAEGVVRIDYVVRPGHFEETRTSGPTGYRIGYIDREFGLFSGRQVALLRVNPVPPRRIEVAFLLPEGGEVVAPWEGERRGDTFDLRGDGAAARLLDGVIGVGRFETSAEGPFRAAVSRAVPEGIRQAALERAHRLERFLASRLGPLPGPYTLLLVPAPLGGGSISVPPGAESFGTSLGAGVPSRWLAIGRSIGRAHLAEALSGRAPEESRWVLEALPTYLTVAFSDQEGWRSRRAWLEAFHGLAAPQAIDLRQPGHTGENPDPALRERRGALVLDRLSVELARAGRPPVEESLRRTVESGGTIDASSIAGSDLPDPIRDRLERWLAATPHAVPFPGVEEGRAPIRLPEPPPLRPAAGNSRLDVLLSARNLGLLEQSGCRSREAGGIARRATVLRRGLGSGRSAFAIDLGDAVPFDPVSPLLDPQKIAESDLVFDLMARSGVAASVVGHAELHYGARFLAERAARLPPGLGLLAANLRAPGVTLPSRLDRLSRRPRVRIAGAVDPDAYYLGRAVEFEDATASATFLEIGAAVREALGPGPFDGVTIVAGALGPSAILRIHEANPDLDLLVTDDYVHLTRDPRFVFERPIGGRFAAFGMIGRTILVVLRSDAYALVRLGIAVDPEGRIGGADLEGITLDASIPDDPAVRALIDDHYAALAAAGGLKEPSPIGERLVARLRASYAGSAACFPCHQAEADHWRTTPHATAFATILSRRRQGVPACYACHVTGYGQPAGYQSIADQHLRQVGCEACHGPGSRHVEDRARETIVRNPPAGVCFECHDAAHSEMTVERFEEYRSKIRHPHQPAPAPRENLIDGAAALQSARLWRRGSGGALRWADWRRGGLGLADPARGRPPAASSHGPRRRSRSWVC